MLPGTGADGNAVESDLLARGMPVEMADRDTVVAMVTLADTPEGLVDLAIALVESVDRHRGSPRPVVTSGVWAVDPVTVTSPREAFFAPRESVASSRPWVGSAPSWSRPYPPGIPVLAPGEEVTLEAVEALRAARAAGSRIAYAADPTRAHPRRHRRVAEKPRSRRPPQGPDFVRLTRGSAPRGPPEPHPSRTRSMSGRRKCPAPETRRAPARARAPSRSG